MSLTSLPKSLQYIGNKLANKNNFTPSEVRKIVIEANVNSEELMPWADYDHPLSDSYGRKLVYQGAHFEIMVMSWTPGDFSGIHDHGFTSWGAVQVFGPAEHATFRIEDNELVTLARWDMKPGDVIGVNHQLIHQMGNPSNNTNFISLHVYGTPENQDNITGDARVFALDKPEIQRVDGGVFYALPKKEIKWTEAAPEPNFSTYIRYMVELAKRMQKMDHPDAKEISKKIADPSNQKKLDQTLKSLVNEQYHVEHYIQWKILNLELKALAAFQKKESSGISNVDHFNKYAEVYDSLIGQPCLNSFMAGYLQYFFKNHSAETVLSIGSGTGISEAYIINQFGIDKEKLLGIDVSESMVRVASRRINVIHADILTWNPSQQFDLAYSGLNVFHYLPHSELENAINRAAQMIRKEGWFVGDFITPDHIRWYPNLMISEDSKVYSLRTPKLIEEDGRMFQESDIINVSFRSEEMEVNYAGTHRRFLPPMNRIRQYFQKAFKGEVQLLDAISLEIIPESSDSCPSTRYVVMAQKS